MADYIVPPGGTYVVMENDMFDLDEPGMLERLIENENKPYIIDWSRRLPAGVTIDSVSVTNQGVEPITLSDFAVLAGGRKVRFYAKNGSQGQDHAITVTVQTNETPPAIYIRKFLLPCRAST